MSNTYSYLYVEEVPRIYVELDLVKIDEYDGAEWVQLDPWKTTTYLRKTIAKTADTVADAEALARIKEATRDLMDNANVVLDGSDKETSDFLMQIKNFLKVLGE
jgi:hypothetical protein